MGALALGRRQGYTHVCTLYYCIDYVCILLYNVLITPYTVSGLALPDRCLKLRPFVASVHVLFSWQSQPYTMFARTNIEVHGFVKPFSAMSLEDNVNQDDMEAAGSHIDSAQNSATVDAMITDPYWPKRHSAMPR